MVLRTVCVIVAGLMLLGARHSPARAQGAEPPCVLDKCLGATPPPTPSPEASQPSPVPVTQDNPSAENSPRGSTATGAFDFYVLALSWSPGFCITGGADKAPDQCAAGSNLGFVVHGLWPQSTHGFPSNCGPAGRSPSRQALDTVRGVYPDVGLARYEWTKHGTCTGQSPGDYFADVKRARAGIVIPDAFQAPQQDQTVVPIDMARAFSSANPGLRPNAMAVTCRQGTLEEVRICLSKDLRGYVTCPEVARASCRTRQMSVPGLR